MNAPPRLPLPSPATSHAAAMPPPATAPRASSGLRPDRTPASDTFMQLPALVATNTPGNRVRGGQLAVLGIPWDGSVTCRRGASAGPKAIREASRLCRSHSLLMGVEVFGRLPGRDAGDVAVRTGDPAETMERIAACVTELHDAGADVIALGGDHSVLVPILRATSRRHAGLTLIQIDAHFDTTDAGGPPWRHHGTCVRDAIAEESVAGHRVFQIGLRGSVGTRDYFRFAEEQGISLLTMCGAHDPAGRAAFLARLRRQAGDGPCYLTFDIDGVDPAFAPGTGTPVPGGFTSYEALALLREFKGLNVVGADVVEVAPAYDSPGQITSLLAAALVLELGALIAASPRHRT